jgi:hypothetical protein
VTWSIRLVLWTLGYTRIVKTTIVNADVVPAKGAVLLAANHTSMVDVLFILAALRREAIAMAMAELWKSPMTRWLARPPSSGPLRSWRPGPGSTRRPGTLPSCSSWSTADERGRPRTAPRRRRG